MRMQRRDQAVCVRTTQLWNHSAALTQHPDKLQTERRTCHTSEGPQEGSQHQQTACKTHRQQTRATSKRKAGSTLRLQSTLSWIAESGDDITAECKSPGEVAKTARCQHEMKEESLRNSVG